MVKRNKTLSQPTVPSTALSAENLAHTETAGLTRHSSPRTQPVQVVIIGRPNVGKSTLFNRLIGKRRALVHDFPGVTRDRMEEKAEWWVRAQPIPVLMVDTGGLGGDRFADEIEKQVKIALESADIVLFLFDSKAGLLPEDQELYRHLSKSGLLQKIPVLAVINKVDAEMHESRVSDFYELGMDQVLTLSAEHNRGIEDLKTCIAETLGLLSEKPNPVTEDSDEDFSEMSDAEVDTDLPDPTESTELTELEEEAEEENETEATHLASSVEAELEPSATPHRLSRIAIVGRPNVGKSTLINALLREERMITSPMAGTTIDSIDSVVELNGIPFVMIDTAGIRRKGKTEQGVEVLSVLQSKKALERADLAILVLDGEAGISDQDEKIGGLIEQLGCSVILAVNKWDTQERNKDFNRELAAEQVRERMRFLKYAPIVFMSAKRGKGLDKLGALFEEILHQRKLKIPTREFTEWVREKSNVHNPMNAKFYMCHQTGSHPPTFVCHVNSPDKINFSLKGYLTNSMREKWGFMGTPLRLLFVEDKNNRPSPRK